MNVLCPQQLFRRDAIDLYRNPNPPDAIRSICTSTGDWHDLGRGNVSYSSHVETA